jgi:hypothetical protein
MITAGGSYTMDAISIGLEGLYNHYDTGIPHNGVGSHAEYYGASLNAAYALGPGISLEGQVAWTQSNSNYSNGLAVQDIGSSVNSYELDIGTAINF